MSITRLIKGYMATNSQTPNMLLTVPTVGQELGPTYAYDVNSDLSLIDLHDHSPGKGVQITPDGIDITSALAFNNNVANSLAGVVFQAQSTPSSTLQGLSVAPGGEAVPIEDLFYTDSAGNVIQLTKAGETNVTLASLPGESYAGGTFTWRQGAGSTVPANFDIGHITIRPNIAATTFGVTLTPPTAISSAYTIQLPADPTLLSVTSIFTLSPAGVMGELSSGVNGQFVRQNTSGVPALQGKNANVTSTGAITYASTASDDVILAQNNQTITVDATLNPGQEITIKKVDAALTNVITITAAGSQTIDGAASTTLNTQNESITITSDGSVWYIVDSNRNTVPVGLTSPAVITGYGTVTTSNIFSWRQGAQLHMRGWFVGAVPAGTAASIEMAFNGTPGIAGLTPSSVMTSPGSGIGAVIGTWGTNSANGQNQGEMLYVVGAGNVIAFGQPSKITASALQETNGNKTMNVNGQIMSFQFSIPIAGWNA